MFTKQELLLFIERQVMYFGRDLEVTPSREEQVSFPTSSRVPEKATVRLPKFLAKESQRPVASEI